MGKCVPLGRAKGFVSRFPAGSHIPHPGRALSLSSNLPCLEVEFLVEKSNIDIHFVVWHEARSLIA